MRATIPRRGMNENKASKQEIKQETCLLTWPFLRSPSKKGTFFLACSLSCLLGTSKKIGTKQVNWTKSKQKGVAKVIYWGITLEALLSKMLSTLQDFLATQDKYCRIVVLLP